MSDTTLDTQLALERMTDLLLEAHAIARTVNDRPLEILIATGLLHIGQRLAQQLGATETETSTHLRN